MKTNILLASLLLMTLIPQTDMAASGDGTRGERPLFDSKETIHLSQATGAETAKHYKDYYRTWTVVTLTDEEIVLERTTSNGEIDTVTISRSRRPDLEVDDKVRYDKIRNRLGNTLDK